MKIVHNDAILGHQISGWLKAAVWHLSSGRMTSGHWGKIQSVLIFIICMLFNFNEIHLLFIYMLVFIQNIPTLEIDRVQRWNLHWIKSLLTVW